MPFYNIPDVLFWKSQALQSWSELLCQCRFSQGLHCSRCDRSFTANETSVDLTPTSGADMRVYKQKFWGGTQLFR